MARRYNMTATDTRAIVNTAARLGIRPDVLASVIAYETMGTMNPTIKGGKGGNYQGLIQFGPPERKAYGYSADASFAEQVEGPVYRYLKDRGVKPGHGVAEVYSIINAGSLKNGKPRWNASDGNGTVRSHVQNIISRIMPRMASMLEGAAPSTPNMDAIADVANYSQVDGGSIGQPETAIASSPQTAAAAINDLIASGPAGPPVDALAYNTARAQAIQPLSGQGQTETMVGGVMPPTPRVRPQTNAGFPGQLDYVASGNAPAPRPRPDRLAPPTESMVRPDDYIAGRMSGLSADTMNAGLYRSRADQMPVPPSRPEANVGFPAQLDYMLTGMLPNPRIAPPRSVDIPTPRLRPVETQTSPSLVVGPPPRPIGALPAATPERMSDAEYQAMKDEIAALGAKYGTSAETPEQAADRMTREREQMFADMDARAGQGMPPVKSTNVFSPGQTGVAVRDVAQPMSQRFSDAFAPNDNTALEQALADRQMAGRFDDAFAPAPQLDLNRTSPVADALNSANRFLFDGAETGLSDVANWLNSGGTTPASATPSPLPAPAPSPMPPPMLPPKDQSRVPESNWFATQSFPPVPKPPVVDTVNPIQIGPSSSIDPTATDMMSSLGKPMGSVAAMPRYASSEPIVMPTQPLGITVPVPPSPPTISMSAFNERFGGPTLGTKPTGAPSSIALGDPIDIRPPVTGGPVIAPPSVVPQKPAPPQITSAPSQKQTAALGVLSTILGGPGRLFGGGGGGLFGGGSPFTQSSANAFQATGGGTHPSGQTYKTGTIGSTNWNAGQYDNSKGQTVTYATDPWQGGYMVSIG